MTATTNILVGNIPQELRDRAQWVAWQHEWLPDKDKPTKIAFSIKGHGRKARANDPTTWGAFHYAMQCVKSGKGIAGVMYAFSEDDPYVGIDLDNVPDQDDWIAAFNSYSERSPSGEGVHIIIRAQMPGGKGRKRGGYEAYSERRFFSCTGHHIEGTPLQINDRQDVLDRFIGTVFPIRKPANNARSNGHDNIAEDELNVILGDVDVLDQTQNDIRNGATFRRLWSGNTDGYPSHSEADLAMLTFLAYRTQDRAQLDRIFRMSGLMRDKWERDDYREATLDKALNRQTYSRTEHANTAEEDLVDNVNEPEQQAPPLADLLGDVVAFVDGYVVLTTEQCDAVALWVAHTHVIAAADATPYINVKSAEKRSGKTRLLECLELLVARPWLTGRTTAAALARKIDKQHPTLLLDESDTAFKGEKEYAETLRGVLNSGHRRGGAVTVCVGQGANLDFRDFSTFAAKAIAGIGQLPDTVADRCIPLELLRKKPNERVKRFRYRIAATEAKPTHASLAAWALEAISVLLEAEPELPEELDDRAQDGWESLLAIADLAGADWPKRARDAALVLSAGRAADDNSLGIRLLADVRGAFETRAQDRLPTNHLLATLNSIEAAPWGGFHDGHGMTARDLADILKRYAIEPRVIKLPDDKTARGYRREDFNDAWARYVPEKRNQRNHPHPDAKNDQKTDVTEAAKLRREKADFPHVEAKVTQVTDNRGEHGGNSHRAPTGQQFCRVCGALLPLQHLRNLGLCWDCAEQEAAS